jgi:ubiquinone/menaquinone biosynthesis C-methylase UbiE
VAEFDEIADVYDSTRRPASEAEISALRSGLEHSRTVLDVGVGTGRFAKPLTDSGFDVCGIDISKGMMVKAKEKGVSNLVLGDASILPFSGRAFDAAIMVHVLHLLPDWRGVVREVARVTRTTIIALLREGPGQGEQPGSSPQHRSLFWQEYLRLRAEMGYPVNENRLRMWRNQEEVKNAAPPAKLEKVSEEVGVFTPGDMLGRFQDRWPSNAFGVSRGVPEEVHQKIVEKLRTTLPLDMNRTIERRRVEEMAVWSPEQLALV